MFRECDRLSVETVTLNKYAAEYEYMRKQIVVFSASFRVVALKFPELIRFALPNHWFSSKS